MIDTNVKGLLYVSRLISPIMIENKKGHIINISSIAGRETYPFGNVYCATKHAKKRVEGMDRFKCNLQRTITNNKISKR